MFAARDGYVDIGRQLLSSASARAVVRDYDTDADDDAAERAADDAAAEPASPADGAPGGEARASACARAPRARLGR